MVDLFTPSQKILDAICMLPDSHVHHTFLPPNIRDVGFVHHLKSIEYQIGAQYHIAKHNVEENKKYHIFGYTLGEVINNARAHGPRNTPIVIGLFLGEKGVCAGVQDGGDFFKNEQIKEAFEHRVPIQKTGKKILGLSGSHLGVEKTVYNCDMIEVDAKNGILYIADYLQPTPL